MGWLYNRSEWNPIIMQPVGSWIYNSDEICNDFTVHVDTLNLGSNKPLVHRHVKEITLSLVNHLESWVAQDQAAAAVEKDPTNGSCYVHQSRGYFFGLSQELSSFNHLFMVTSRKIPRKNLTESGWSHCRHGPACYVRRPNQTHMTSGHMWRGRPTSETVSSTFKLKF